MREEYKDEEGGRNASVRREAYKGEEGGIQGEEGEMR